MRGNFRASESRVELVRVMPSAAENLKSKEVKKYVRKLFTQPLEGT